MRSKIRSGYDAVAADYAAEISSELAHKPLDRALLDAFVEMVGADCWVLDVGCGPGHIAAYLADRGASVLGLDLSSEMCTIAATSAGLSSVATDMTALAVRTESVAGIVCAYAVIHLDDQQRRLAYAEFARVLRPGGHALIAFHIRDSDVVVGGRKTITDWWGHTVDVTFHYLDPGAQVSLLDRAGFELIARLDRVGDPAVEHPSERSYLLVRRR